MSRVVKEQFGPLHEMLLASMSSHGRNRLVSMTGMGVDGTWWDRVLTKGRRITPTKLWSYLDNVYDPAKDPFTPRELIDAAIEWDWGVGVTPTNAAATSPIVKEFWWIRVNHHISTTQLCRSIHMCSSQVYNMESGDRGCSLEHSLQLAEAFISIGVSRELVAAAILRSFCPDPRRHALMGTVLNILVMSRCTLAPLLLIMGGPDLTRARFLTGEGVSITTIAAWTRHATNKYRELRSILETGAVGNRQVLWEALMMRDVPQGGLAKHLGTNPRLFKYMLAIGRGVGELDLTPIQNMPLRDDVITGVYVC